MIDRAEASGVAVSVIAHAALFGLLSLGFVAATKPLVSPSTPIQVTLSDEVGLVSAAPDPSAEPPAQAAQGDQAQPEPDTTPPDADADPDPAPPKPKADPDSAHIPAPTAKSTKTTPTQQPSRKTPVPTGRVTDPSKSDGHSDQPSPGNSNQSQATMTGLAQANIASAILRQIQPCANRQVDPGPGANRIKVTVQLHLNRDGSLIDRPTVVGTPQFVDEGNERYVARVKDLAIATFMGCSPLHGLPVELWDVQKGWRNFRMTYKLPD